MKKSAITVLKNIIREEISKLISEDKDDEVLDGKPGVINKKGDKKLDPQFVRGVKASEGGDCAPAAGCRGIGYEHLYGNGKVLNLCVYPRAKNCVIKGREFEPNTRWYAPKVGFEWIDTRKVNARKLKSVPKDNSFVQRSATTARREEPSPERSSKSRSRGSYRYLSGGRYKDDFGSRMKALMRKRYGFSNAAGFIRFYKELEERGVIKKTRGRRSKFLVGPKQGNRFIKDKVFGGDHAVAWVAVTELSPGHGKESKETSQYIGVAHKGCESPRSDFQRMVCGMPPRDKRSPHRGVVIELPYSRSGGRSIWVPTDEKLARKIQKAQMKRFAGSWIDVSLIRCLKKTQTPEGCRSEIIANLKKYWEKRIKKGEPVSHFEPGMKPPIYGDNFPAAKEKKPINWDLDSGKGKSKSDGPRKYRQSAAGISGTFSMYTDSRNKAYWDKKGGMIVNAALKDLAEKGHPFAKKLKSWVEKGAKGDPPKQTKKIKKTDKKEKK